MLIRLELKYKDSEQREGIYQMVDPFTLNEVCEDASFLPVPRSMDIVPTDDVVLFWFTLKGWIKYGRSFLELLYDPQGMSELSSLDSPIFLSIIEDGRKLFKAYKDDYQVALKFPDCLNPDKEFKLWDKDDIKQLELYPELLEGF